MEQLSLSSYQKKPAQNNYLLRFSVGVIRLYCRVFTRLTLLSG